MNDRKDLAAWLRLAILVRRDVAMKATPGPWEFEGDDATDDELFTVHDGEHGDLIGQPVAFTRGRQVANGQHMAMNDPRDVIARCEAELAIMDEHAPEWIDYRDGDGIERASRECIACEPPGTPDNYPCRTVILLASGYRHWPGYREEDWKPD